MTRYGYCADGFIDNFSMNKLATPKTKTNRSMYLKLWNAWARRCDTFTWQTAQYPCPLIYLFYFSEFYYCKAGSLLRNVCYGQKNDYNVIKFVCYRILWAGLKFLYKRSSSFQQHCPLQAFTANMLKHHFLLEHD